MNHRPIVNLDNLWLSFLDVKDDNIDVKDDMDISGDESINEESTCTTEWHRAWEPRDVAGWSALRSSPPSAHHFAFFDWAILVRMPLHHNDGLPLALLTIHLGSIINVTCALLGCAILLYFGFRRKSEFNPQLHISRFKEEKGRRSYYNGMAKAHHRL
jgi:hypothetical protein